MSIENKTALVTGSSRGIGAAIALELAKKGAYVIGTATTQEGAEQFSRRLREQNLNGKGIVLNISDPESIQNGFSLIEKDHPTIEI